jgi:hypothetical protein
VVKQLLQLRPAHASSSLSESSISETFSSASFAREVSYRVPKLHSDGHPTPNHLLFRLILAFARFLPRPSEIPSRRSLTFRFVRFPRFLLRPSPNSFPNYFILFDLLRSFPTFQFARSTRFARIILSNSSYDYQKVLLDRLSRRLFREPSCR